MEKRPHLLSKLADLGVEDRALGLGEEGAAHDNHGPLGSSQAPTEGMTALTQLLQTLGTVTKVLQIKMGEIQEKKKSGHNHQGAANKNG